MARVMDTRVIAPPNVGDVVRDLFAHNTIPLDVTVDTTAPLIMDAAQFGPVGLLSTRSRDLCLTRAVSQTEESIAFAMQRTGTAWLEYDGKPAKYFTPGQLFITDQSAPYRYHAQGSNAASSVEMSYAHLGLPVDVARKGAERLTASPLYDLVSSHLIILHRDLDRIEADPAAPTVMAATTDLLRALVASASDLQRYARPAVADALLPLILAYARQHLRERDLTPERIARHHDISLRYLYKLCAAADIRLMDWIVQQRLAGAREDLTHPGRRMLTIAAIAHGWGFKDARHFSARFRDRYGCSPREWRAGGASTQR